MGKWRDPFPGLHEKIRQHNIPASYHSPGEQAHGRRSQVFHEWMNIATAKSLQSCPTLCDPIDGSPPSSPIPGILQARTLEWVAISFSNAWKWKVKGKSLSRIPFFATPWTAAHQAPPSMGFSRQEYWSGVPLNVTNILILGPAPTLPFHCPLLQTILWCRYWCPFS